MAPALIPVRGYSAETGTCKVIPTMRTNLTMEHTSGKENNLIQCLINGQLTHFVLRVLYGRSTTTTSLSQTITNLSANSVYILQYYYNVEQASPQAICRLTTTIGGQVVDTLTSPTVRTGGYLSRQVSYTSSSTSAVLQFTLVCPRFVQLTAQSNYALDAITLTTGASSC